MEQIPLSPDVINKSFLYFDFIVKNREVVTDFFGDNRLWYTELTLGNQNRSYDIGADKNGITIHPPKHTVWLHEEKDLEVDKENPPLNPLLINEGKAEMIASFFERNPVAAAAFHVYCTALNK